MRYGNTKFIVCDLYEDGWVHWYVKKGDILETSGSDPLHVFVEDFELSFKDIEKLKKNIKKYE